MSSSSSIVLHQPTSTVVVNPVEPLKTTGLELGLRLSDLVSLALLGSGKPTTRLEKIGSAIEQRMFDVGINTFAPLCLLSASENFGYLAIRSRSLLGLGLNASGVISHTLQALDPHVPQFGAHAGEALKYLYRGGIDASIYGINLIHPEAGVYLIAAEGVSLLLAPYLVRSAASTVFRTVDALVDTAIGKISQLVHLRQPTVRLAITDAQLKSLQRDEPFELEEKENGLEIAASNDEDRSEEEEGYLTMSLEPSSTSSASSSRSSASSRSSGSEGGLLLLSEEDFFGNNESATTSSSSSSSRSSASSRSSKREEEEKASAKRSDLTLGELTAESKTRKRKRNKTDKTGKAGEITRWSKKARKIVSK